MNYEKSKSLFPLGALSKFKHLEKGQNMNSYERKMKSKAIELSKRQKRKYLYFKEKLNKKTQSMLTKKEKAFPDQRCCSICYNSYREIGYRKKTRALNKAHRIDY